MHLLGYLTFFSGLTFLGLGLYVFLQNPKSILNISVTLLSWIFATWCFPAAFYFNDAMTLESLWLANHIACLGWIGFPVLFFWFVLIFSENKSKFFSFTCFLYVLLCLGLIYKQITANAIISYFEKSAFGWAYGFSDSKWFYAYIFYFISTFGLGFIRLIHFYFTRKNEIRKKQTIIILSTTSLGVTLGYIDGVIFPKFEMFWFPAFSQIIALVWVVAVVIIIVKYKFLRISPTIAADQIIETMNEALFLLDPFSDIVTVNEAGKRLLQGSAKKIIGKPITDFFQQDNIDEKNLEHLIKKGLIFSQETYCKTLKGEMVPVLLNSSLIKDDSQEILGKVFLAHNIDEINTARTEMRKQAEMNNAIIDCLPGVFYVFDQKGRFLKWNKNLEKVSGYSSAEIAKMTPLDFFKKEVTPNVQKAIEKGFKEGTASLKEKFMTKSGEEIPYFFTTHRISLDGKPYLLGTGVEVNESKKTI